MSDSEKDTIPCNICMEDTSPEKLKDFEKGRVKKEGICPACYKHLKSVHVSAKKSPARTPEPEPEQKPVYSLSKKNLSRFLGGSERDLDERSDSGASTISANFSKFYCCEPKCKTKTGRFKHFRSNDAWLIHMLKEHKATLSYGDYLMMEHVVENFPHEENDALVSKFGNLGV